MHTVLFLKAHDWRGGGAGLMTVECLRLAVPKSIGTLSQEDVTFNTLALRKNFEGKGRGGDS